MLVTNPSKGILFHPYTVALFLSPAFPSLSYIDRTTQQGVSNNLIVKQKVPTLPLLRLSLSLPLPVSFSI